MLVRWESVVAAYEVMNRTLLLRQVLPQLDASMQSCSKRDAQVCYNKAPLFVISPSSLNHTWQETILVRTIDGDGYAGTFARSFAYIRTIIATFQQLVSIILASLWTPLRRSCFQMTWQDQRDWWFSTGPLQLLTLRQVVPLSTRKQFEIHARTWLPSSTAAVMKIIRQCATHVVGIGDLFVAISLRLFYSIFMSFQKLMTGTVYGSLILVIPRHLRKNAASLPLQPIQRMYRLSAWTREAFDAIRHTSWKAASSFCQQRAQTTLWPIHHHVSPLCST